MKPQTHLKPQGDPGSRVPGGPGMSEPALRFDVGGMHCAGCARRVEETLRHQPGVTDAAVNFATAEAWLTAGPELDGSVVGCASMLPTAVAPRSNDGRPCT